MPDQFPANALSGPTPAVPSSGTAKHVRAAALVAALLPLAQIVAMPVTVSAQGSGGTTGSVPEPASLVLLAPAAAWLVRRQLKK
jgi:hypothetical protein